MKKDLTNLSSLVEKIGKLWDSKMYITASVIVQNMAFEADDQPESYFDKHLDILRGFKELRHNDHVLDWVYNEALMIVTEHFIMLSDSLESDNNVYWPPLYSGDDEAQDFEKFGKHKI
jgi:hypothetical protein